MYNTRTVTDYKQSPNTVTVTIWFQSRDNSALESQLRKENSYWIKFNFHYIFIYIFTLCLY
jgi:hypothetical protein